MRCSWMAGLLLATLMLAGCSTTGPFGRNRLALPIGPSYVGGRGMQMFPTSPDLLANVKEAMGDVGIHTIVQNEDPSGLLILEGKTVDARKARVTILTSGANATVSARIGWMGDEPLTRSLLDRISGRHGNMPPSRSIESSTEGGQAETPRTSLFSREAVPDSTMLRGQLEGESRP